MDTLDNAFPPRGVETFKQLNLPLKFQALTLLNSIPKEKICIFPETRTEYVH